MPSRRQFLRRAGVGLGVSLTGCLAPSSPATPPATDTGEPTTASPATDVTDTETSAPTTDAPVAWRRRLDDAVAWQPTVASGRIYVATRGGVRALAPDDGGVDWRSDRADVRGSPVVGDGAVFGVAGEMSLGADHEAFALEAETGRERWTFAPESWYLEPVGVRGQTLFVATYDDAVSDEGQTLYALATDTGETRWSAEVGDLTGGVVGAGGVYVPSYGRVYGYDAADGSRRFAVDVGEYVHGTIGVRDDTVYYVAESEDEPRKRELVARDAVSGEKRWSGGGWLATSATFGSDTVYLGGAHLAAFDLATGERRWKTDDGGFLARSPVRDGRVYAGGTAVRALATDDGEEVWSWSPSTDGSTVVPAAATASAVFVDGVVDEDRRNRRKFAVGTASGETRWTFASEAELTDLVLADGLVLAGDESGVVTALDASA
jgi:outer membrane protein assembly factor BamB